MGKYTKIHETREQALPPHHITDESPHQQEGIVVPLDLNEMQMVTQYQQADGRLCVEVMARTHSAVCPHCQQESGSLHDCRPRHKRDLPLRGYQVTLILWKRRFRCGHCRKTFTEPDQACGYRKRTTVRLRIHLGKQACTRPIAQVAQEAGVGPRFVQTCWQRVAKSAIEQAGGQTQETASLPTPRFLGIDEFAVRKGHHYATILCDLEHRRVLEVRAGRTQEEVVALLSRLSNPEAVEAVSMDMSASFRPAVQAALPQAQIVVDHFHVIQHVMKAFRKVVSSWAHKKEGMVLLHHKQHLFLHAREHLSEEQAQKRARIAAHLPLLQVAWQLKEALRTWYATATAETAGMLLDQWLKQVRSLGPEPLQKALSIFTRWREEILAFFRFLPTHRLSNGFVEGKNNRTKMLMRQAYGYRNLHHLRLRIFLGDVA